MFFLSNRQILSSVSRFIFSVSLININEFICIIAEFSF